MLVPVFGFRLARGDLEAKVMESERYVSNRDSGLVLAFASSPDPIRKLLEKNLVVSLMLPGQLPTEDIEARVSPLDPALSWLLHMVNMRKIDELDNS